MSSLMNRLTDARPARLDPDPGTGLDPAEIMAHPRPARPGRRLPRRLVLAGLVPAAAVATAVAVFATSSSPPSPPARTARDVLLVAADRAATERAGTWWVTDTVNGFRGDKRLEAAGRRKQKLHPPQSAEERAAEVAWVRAILLGMHMPHLLPRPVTDKRPH